MSYKFNPFTGTFDDVGSPAPSGNPDVNFLSINNSRFITSVGDWVPFDDGAVAVPIDLTGGSPTVISIARGVAFNSTGNARITHTAANGQGEGVSALFSVEPAYRSSSVSLTFNYQTSSGYLDGDLELWIYDVTNSQLIQPVPYKLLASLSPGVFTAQFQTSATGASYRVGFFSPNTTATAYTVDFYNIVIGPSMFNFGSVSTDWRSEAATVVFTGFGAPTAISYETRRDGPDLLVRGKFTSGTPTATEARISLVYRGVTVTSADTVTLPSIETCGVWMRDTAAAAHGSVMLIEPSVTYLTMGQGDGFSATATSGTAKMSASSYVASGNVVFFNARAPISGWATNVQTSDSADSRIVAASYYLSANFAATTTTPINFDTRVFDTHNAVTTSATAWKFTAPVSGEYYFNAVTDNNAATTEFQYLYKNGTLARRISSTTAGNSGYSWSNPVVLRLVAGDYIDVRPGTSQTIRGGAEAGANTSRIEVFKLQGPSSIGATESIAARYYNSATSISGTLATVVWTTKDFDTHGALTSGVFTCPSAGKYQVNLGLALAGTFILNTTTVVEIQKNGTAVTNVTHYIAAAVTNEHVQVSDIISCVAGDTIRIQVSNSGTTPTIVSSNTRNFVSIQRLGL